MKKAFFVVVVVKTLYRMGETSWGGCGGDGGAGDTYPSADIPGPWWNTGVGFTIFKLSANNAFIYTLLLGMPPTWGGWDCPLAMTTEEAKIHPFLFVTAGMKVRLLVSS